MYVCIYLPALAITPESKIYVKLLKFHIWKEFRSYPVHSIIPVSQMRDLRPPPSPELFQLFSGLAKTRLWFSRLSGQNSYTQQPSKSVNTLLSNACVINSQTRYLTVIILQEWNWSKDKGTPPLLILSIFLRKMILLHSLQLTHHHSLFHSFLIPQPPPSLSSLFASFALLSSCYTLRHLCPSSNVSSSCWNLA